MFTIYFWVMFKVYDKIKNKLIIEACYENKFYFLHSIMSYLN